MRLEKFTSSEVYNLMSEGKGSQVGKPFYTYIRNKLFEHQAGRELTNSSNAKPTAWGTYMEKYVFENYLKYSKMDLESKNVIPYLGEIEELHDFYCGTPDLIGANSVGDIKCPFTLVSFLIAFNCVDILELIKVHPDGEKFYWQLISNAILTGKDNCTLTFWVPRGYRIEEYGEEESEILRIHDQIKNCGDPTMQWGLWADTEELPYLLNKETAQIKTFEFEATKTEKQRLLDRLVLATKELKRLLNG